MPDLVTDLTKGIYRRMYSGFIKGHKINSLSLEAEAWFWRVTASADDFGNADAEPSLCFAATVGRRKKITIELVAQWLDEMQSVGLIQIYSDGDGDKYLHIHNVELVQPAGKNGRKIRKFPEWQSKGIQNNPDVDLASHSHSHSHSHSETQKKERHAKPRDERVDHPAMLAYREVRGRFPSKDVWDLIIDKLGAAPDVSKLRECWLAWRTRNYGPENLGWLVDWYLNGMPTDFRSNGNGKNQQYKSAAERNSDRVRANLAMVAELRSAGSGDNH